LLPTWETATVTVEHDVATSDAVVADVDPL
jgi:hypothetical protein